MLRYVNECPEPPFLIVTSRRADEYLWTCLVQREMESWRGFRNGTGFRDFDFATACCTEERSLQQLGCMAAAQSKNDRFRTLPLKGASAFASTGVRSASARVAALVFRLVLRYCFR